MAAHYYQDVYDGKWKPVPVPVPLDLVIRAAVLNALAYADGVQARAAMLLKVTPRVFKQLMVKHHVPSATIDWRRKGGRPKRRSAHDLFVARKPASLSPSKRTIQ